MASVVYHGGALLAASCVGASKAWGRKNLCDRDADVRLGQCGNTHLTVGAEIRMLTTNAHDDTEL